MKEITLKSVLLFSLPSVFSSLLEPLTGIVDTALVGQVDTLMLAALGLATVLLSSFSWVFNFLIHATTQAISSSVSLKDEKESIVVEKIKISLITTLIVGVMSVILLFLLRYFLYQMIGARELTTLVNSYFVIRLIGHPFTLLYSTLLSALRGLGLVGQSFYIILLTTTINIAFSAIFLFVLDYGIEGVAWGSVLANFVGMIVSFFVLSKHENLRGIFSVKTDVAHWFHFGKNSSSLFVRSLFLTGAIFLSSRFVSFYGGEHLAAHQIVLQLWLFCSFFTDGIAITANVWGGYLFSQREREKIIQLNSKMLALGLYLGVTFAAIYFLFPRPILRIFTNDPQVIEIILAIWPWIAIAQVTSCVAYVYDGILFGISGFRHLAIHMVIGVLLIFLPFSLWGRYEVGLLGIWIGMIFLNLYRGVSCFFVSKKILREI